MIVQKFLVIKSNGNVTIKHKEPRLAGNEICLKLSLDVPYALFIKPTLVANMTIPSEAIPRSQIVPSVTTNIEKIIKDSTGLTMSVRIVEHEDSIKENDK